MTEPVHRVPLLDQTLEPARPVDHVVVRRITMQPGVASGAHRHNSPVLGSIEQGSAVLQVEDGPEVRLRPGDVFHEPEGRTIRRFDATDEGCVFLGYFLLPAGEEPEIAFLD
jgi:quercetin dioxygenase-like cupin family protein